MESTMTLYIGVDYHPYQQTIAYCESETGEIRYRQFLHSDKTCVTEILLYWQAMANGKVII